MKRLGERLARMNPGARRPAEDEPALPAPAATRPTADAPAPTEDDVGRAAAPDPEHVDALRDWWRAPTDFGPAYVHRERLSHPACETVPELHHYLSDERLAGFAPERALYLDIEATGLSHGAGTFAFLIGCAYFDRGDVVLEQLFMRDPMDELPVLARFLDLVERFPYLVSFNGKSYDLSVLQTRLVINRLLSRQEVDLKVRPHLDLLHVSRQAYKDVFENTRLQTLEREVLGLPPSEREDDVPGSLVPAIYFHYLQTGYAPQLDVVLRHNRTDVISMVSLTDHLGRLFADPTDAPARVLFNLGRAASRRKLHDRAAALLAQAIDGRRLDHDTHRSALEECVAAHRRADKLAEAHLYARALHDHLPAWAEDERARVARQITRFERKLNRQSKTR